MNKLVKILFFVTLLCGIQLQSSATNEGMFPPEQRIKFITCYPNPATTNINFQTNNLSDKSFVLTIYNFIGKKVEEIKLNSEKANISLDNYYRGLYVYQLRNKQGILIESGKFQVVR